MLTRALASLPSHRRQRYRRRQLSFSFSSSQQHSITTTD